MYIAISVDTDEAREYVTHCLGWRWLDWQEGSSHAYSVARNLPEAGVWSVTTPDGRGPDMGTVITISAPDDGYWGGPISLECFAP